MYNLPFTITDVVDNISLENVKDTGASMITATCPFCGGKTTLHINRVKNVWRCPRCDESGGVLDLYSKFNNITGVDANKEAYHDICNLLNIENDRGQKERSKQEFKGSKSNPTIANRKEIVNSPLADPNILDHTYRIFLNSLTLNDVHKESLLKRGLTEEEIDYEMYRSLPIMNKDKIILDLLAFEVELNGIPGFYKDSSGWHMSVFDTGVFIPYKNKEGLIIGMQIRHDESIDGNKYTWFSSSTRDGGCSAGAPYHYIGDPIASTVVLTEGALKGTIAHYLSRKLNLPLTFVCIAGTSQYNSCRMLFKELKLQNVTTVFEALDMDKYKNPYVLKSLNKIYQIAYEEGINLVPYCWNTIFISGLEPNKPYAIKDRNTHNYITYTLGSRSRYWIYNTDKSGLLIIPEPLINPKDPHSDLNCQLVNLETGEMLDFDMYVDKGGFRIKKDSKECIVNNFKGIDDYFLGLYKQNTDVA